MKKSKLGYSSNSDIFERKGNPWATDKEGVKNYGRNLDTEDAEYDFSHRFHNTDSSFGKPKPPPERKEHKDPVPVKQTEPSLKQRKTNILHGMRIDMRKNTVNVK